MIYYNIELIRIKKGLKINELIDGIMSRATYHNFKTGKHEISYLDFFKLVKRLNLMPDELGEVVVDETTNMFKKYMNQLKDLSDQGEVNSLLALKREMNQNRNGLPNKDLLVELVDSHIHQLQGQTFDLNPGSLVSQYLFGAEGWTQYEKIIFNLSLPFLRSELIDIYLDRILSTKMDDQDHRHYGDGHFRLVIRALIIFIEGKDYGMIKKWSKKVEEMPLDPSFVFEISLKKLFHLLVDYILDHHLSSLDKSKRMVKLLEELDCQPYADNLTNIITFVEDHYA
ncbi:transcriptional activator, Rgg/GadR/MutR family, C-terminal domain [Alloiococcus otitis]|uniref:Transcriptional activator, Rgg/GadR/MutR family domain-containing protein n=1 Tax=Alloiococcus otitis ATCC 51267 TaxID=883081 RepID=K9EBQ3_9LACT|nr:Rgg/GadR/MutR family transcriptional regulator [Alloiococcus otitis]EKU93256.1 transcriptional activator, Rgg/GadR/MutR family domain-containing protein [Alloiococcus otitis ATCC 51267]SUU80594.1 transcriptional activator, Rgg/GadR/MutR family, C-terminal domain [Alloiococcus otitis]